VVLLISGGGSTARLSSCGAPLDTDRGRVEVGDRVPDFVLPSLEGGCVRVSDFRGQPLVINFWASWCNPCRREFPRFRAARQQHHDDGLEIVGVTYRDIVSDSRQFADEQHATWPLLVDDDGDVARAFHVGQIPQTFFVDADGRVRSHLFADLTKQQLEREIRRLLAHSSQRK
jgi:peroxiredoxin